MLKISSGLGGIFKKNFIFVAYWWFLKISANDYDKKIGYEFFIWIKDKKNKRTESILR